MTTGRRVRCALLLALAFCSTPAQAGSFFIEESSVQASGRASAGQSAQTRDASGLFYNPANVVGLPRLQVGVSSYQAWLHADLDDKGSDVATPGTLASGAGTATVSGRDGGNPLGDTFLMSFAAAVPLSDERTWLGIGVGTPFGIDIDFGSQWFGRYGATETDLRVADILPTLGYQIGDRLSLGVSLAVRYVSADFRTALPDPLALEGPTPETDGAVSVDGDDWDLGFAIGVRGEPRDGLRIGLAYRSGTKADLEGRARFSGLRGPLAFRNGRVGASTELGLPDLVLLGAAYDATPRLTLSMQLNWFDWSDFDAVEIDLDDATHIVSPQGYHDSWSAALGLEYRLGTAWTLRAGAQFDRTPVDDDLRSPRTPDDDRVRLTTGFSYAMTERVRLDFSYAHVFVRDSEVDRTDTVFAGTPVASTAHTRARTEASADIVGLAVVYEF